MLPVKAFDILPVFVWMCAYKRFLYKTSILKAVIVCKAPKLLLHKLYKYLINESLIATYGDIVYHYRFCILKK